MDGAPDWRTEAWPCMLRRVAMHGHIRVKAMRLRTIICLIIPVVAAGCALVSIPNPIITGSLVVHHLDGGQEVWTADRCLSGDRDNFVGWDFSSSSNGSQLRVLVDPIKGPVGRWQSGPPDAPHTDVLGGKHCDSFSATVKPTVFKFNEVQDYAGHLELKCSLADGSTIEGGLAVDHCH